jgi:hypothetical protein
MKDVPAGRLQAMLGVRTIRQVNTHSPLAVVDTTLV